MLAYLSSIARSASSPYTITSLAAPSLAAPLGPFFDPSTAESSKPLPVAMGEGRDHGPGYRIWPRVGGGNWNGGGRHWNGGGGTGMATAIGTVAGAADTEDIGGGHGG